MAAGGGGGGGGGGGRGPTGTGGATLLGTFTGHTDRVCGVCWVGGDRIVSASWDGTLKLWSVSEQRLLGTFEGHQGSVYCVCWLGDGRIASGSYDTTVKIWDTETRACLQTLTGHASSVACVCVLGDGRLGSGSWKEVKVWSVATGACLGTCTGHTGYVSAVAGLEDGRLVSASADETLKLWDAATQACLGTFTGHTGGVNDVVSVGGGRIVSASYDGTLRLWNVATQACLGTLSGHTGGVYGVAVLGPDKIISCGGDRTLRVWDVNTQACCGTYPTDHSALIWRVAVLPDGRVVTASFDKTLKLFDAGAKLAAGSESKAAEARPAAAPLPAPAPILASSPATPPLPPPSVASLAAEVQVLQRELQTRTEERDDALPTIQRLTAENTDLRGELAPLRRQFQESQAAAAQLQQRLRAAEQKHAESVLALDDALATIQRLTAENANLRAELAPLRQQFQESQAAAEQLQQRLLVAEQRHQQSVEAVDALQRALDHCKYQTPFADANEALVTQSAVIDRDLRLEPIDMLGEGSFGTVFSAARVGDDRVAYCLKRVPLRREAAQGQSLEETERKIMQEGQLLMDIVHPNIVRYHTIYSVSIGDPMATRVTTRCVCIGMELCGGGSLAALTAVPSPAMMREICLQTMQGVAVLHSRIPAVRHGDLKPENICLMSPLGAGTIHVKLIDFGLADNSTLSTVSSARGGSIAFWSPERFVGSGYNIEDDVWGAAISLLFVGVGLSSSHQIKSDLAGSNSGHPDYQARLQHNLAKFRATHGNGLANVLGACLTWERKQRCTARAAFVALKDMKEL